MSVAARLADIAKQRKEMIEDLRAQLAESERKREKAEQELTDWKDSAERAWKNPCKDEIHCTCVPLLVAKLDESERKREEAEEIIKTGQELFSKAEGQVGYLIKALRNIRCEDPVYRWISFEGIDTFEVCDGCKELIGMAGEALSSLPDRAKKAEGEQ